MKKKIIFMIGALMLLNAFRAYSAAPLKIKLKDYEFISYESVKSLDEYANKKVTFDMAFSEYEDLSLKQASNVGFSGSPVSLQYSKSWFKEAYPREKVLLVIEGSFPIGIIGNASLESFVKSLKSGDKITVYGKVRKKELRYGTKRTFIYIEVDVIEKMVSNKDKEEKAPPQ